MITHLAQNIESQLPLDLSYHLLRQGPDATRPADGALSSNTQVSLRERATGAAIIAIADYRLEIPDVHQLIDHLLQQPLAHIQPLGQFSSGMNTSLAYDAQHLF